MDGPQSIDEYKELISEIVKKQIALLGKDIAIAQARNVASITVDDNGTVMVISGEPREALQKVIDQYFVFSGLIVKKAMESLLQSYPGMTSMAEGGQPQQPVQPSTPPQRQPAGQGGKG